MPYLHQYAGDTSDVPSKHLSPAGMISQEKQRRWERDKIGNQELAAQVFNNAEGRKHKFDMAGRRLAIQGLEADARQFGTLMDAFGDAGAGYLNSVVDKRDYLDYLDRRPSLDGYSYGPYGNQPGEDDSGDAVFGYKK